MFRSVKNLIGYPLQAVDGEIGRVADVLFDDRQWGVRYLVAHTGGWLTGRKVLLSPRDLEEPELGWYGKHLPVKLGKESIQNSPLLESDAPVSKEYEEEYARYYKHHLYWEGAFIWGATLTPQSPPHTPEEVARHEEKLEEIAEHHLRSVEELLGYQIQASDGEIGHVHDFVLEAPNWAIRHLVVDTRNWIPGKKVLVDVNWVAGFEWENGLAILDMSEDQVRNAPHFDPHAPINRDYESNLYDYYGKPRYWEEPTGPSM